MGEGIAPQFCLGVGEIGKGRKLVPRDPGKGFIPEELCRLRGTEDQRNTVPNCSFPEHCPVRALFWLCLEYKQAASFKEFSQDSVCHVSVLIASVGDRSQGNMTRSRSQKRLTMSKAREGSKTQTPGKVLLDLAIGRFL